MQIYMVKNTAQKIALVAHPHINSLFIDQSRIAMMLSRILTQYKPRTSELKAAYWSE